MQNKAQWFEQGLGARIDALEIALSALQRGDMQEGIIVRNLAHSLVAPAQMYGYDAISRAARAIDVVTDDGLIESARGLIDVLRQEAAKTGQAVTTILIVGGERLFNEKLCQEIAAPSRNVLCVATAAEAKEAIHGGEIMFIVLNLFLPDLDGRSFLLHLREDASTISIPTLILAPFLTEEVRAEARVIDADVLIESPPDTRVVSDRINSRLRRARETVKVARRDPVTGLPNRAAFREMFSETAEKALATNEPLALALIAIDAPRSTLDRHGREARAAVLGRVGSILSNSLRSTDIIARWGECEFVALFLGEDLIGGGTAVEKIVRLVDQEHFTNHEGETIGVTLSAGVTEVSGGSVDDALSDAHRRLFQAMTDGGNRVVSSQSTTIARTERIMLLVHDGLTSQVMQHLLERDGFAVTNSSRSDASVMAKIEETKHHLIVVDEAIPPEGGFEIVRTLRSRPRNSRTPIVLLIGQNAAQSMAKALEFGANDYMMRPFSPFTFMRRMRRLLRKSVRETGQASGDEICATLIVDRNRKDLLMAASSLYERGGFLPLLAETAAAALERMEQDAPDVVLLDGSLDASAIEQCLAHPAHAKTAHRPAFILLSSTTEPEEHLRQFPKGAFRGVLRKPFNVLSLGNRVEALLGMSPSSARPPNAATRLNEEIQRIMRSGGVTD